MYLLFRYHEILPSQYKSMGSGEQIVLKAFMHYEVEKKNEEIERIRGNI